MRILALDHGTKRIGLALSDESQTIAQPIGFFSPKPMADFLAHIRKIITDKGVVEIIIGMPRNMDGSYGPSAEKVERFVGILQKEIAAPIKTWDERLTSVQANRALGDAGVRSGDRKEKTDAVAAAILLQSYLDRGKEEGNHP
jgi:putative Holliday junction resolvase